MTLLHETAASTDSVSTDSVGADAEPRRLSGAVMVALRSKGPAIPRLAGLPAIPLAPPELDLLARLAVTDEIGPALAAVATAHAVDASRLHGFLDELAVRGLLLDPPSEGPARGGAVGPVPADVVAGEPFLNKQHFGLGLPLTLAIVPGGFAVHDHDGQPVVVLTPAELSGLAEFCQRTTRVDAIRSHRQAWGDHALRESAFDAVIRAAIDAGLLHHLDRGDLGENRAQGRMNRQVRIEMARYTDLVAAIEAETTAHDISEEERRRRTGVVRARVVPVQHSGTLPPLALGMIIATAKQHNGGALEEHFDFHPRWVTSEPQISAMTDEPSIFLFSSYVWSHAQNLSLSKSVKQRNPANITIHGGPDTPRYEGDVEAYFAANPHVDITVRNEGEVTVPHLLEALQAGRTDDGFDLEALRHVEGLCYRGHDGKVVRTPDRERIVDLDWIPSPYLTGLFSSYGDGVTTTAVIETNRGCPYGCTFCDWGSATLSRIRKFSLERVYAELEWCAVNRVGRIFVADANFGIMERDVDIAKKVAELHSQYGYPKQFVTNYAKNTTKYVKQIVQVMTDAGILTEGILSLQSMDAGTLKTIKRSNIKLEKYEELAREFRNAKLPLFVDLMLGLPGSSMTSFMDDIQQCVDREVTPKIHLTELLVNSPMNDPAYRAEHQIDTGMDGHPFYPTIPGEGGSVRRALVVSTSSFTRHDYEEMQRLRRVFLLCENYGVLRQVSRYVRQETGLREVDLYEQLRMVARHESDRWPIIALTLNALPDLMTSPVSWKLWIDEIHRYLVEVCEVPDDATLAAVLDVQHALLPARNRQFPVVLDLPHDYGGWYNAMIEVKDDGYGLDWPDRVPPLRSFPPATFTVDDPSGLCNFGLGHRMEHDDYGNWELQSPVERTMPAQHLME